MKSEWMWDRLANNWDKPGESLGQNDIRIIEKTKKYLKPDCTVMDYGCATGSIALEISGSVKEVHGIDISSRMIGLALKKAAERKVENASFSHSTIFDDRLKKQSFDAVLSFSTLHLIEDASLVFDRIYSLLKPGGVFISATPCTGEKTFPNILITTSLFILTGIRLLPHVNFFRVSGLSDAIIRANFRIVEAETLSLRPVAEAFIVARKI